MLCTCVGQRWSAAVGKIVGWAACGIAVVVLTLWAMGVWPRIEAAGHKSGDFSHMQPSSNAERYSEQNVVPTEQSRPARKPIDALNRLVAAHELTFHAVGSGASSSLGEAMERAMSYRQFSTLASRTDSEGLFEAALWAEACARGTLAAQDAALRCSDPQLRDLSYADVLLERAADSGHPAAIMTLAILQRTQLADIVFRNGDTLIDRVFALASRANASALTLVIQYCAVPNACADEPLTQNVLMLLQQHAANPALPGVESNLVGDPAERRAAIDRESELRRKFGWPS